MKNAKATQKNKMCVCDRGKWTLVVKGTILESVWVRFLGLEDPLEKDRLPTPVFLGFRGGSDSKESICNAQELGSILGWEDPLEKGKATHSSILAWRIPWTV